LKRKRFLNYSLLLSGLSVFKTSRLSAVYTYTQRFFLNKVKFIWAGSVTSISAKVHAKLTTATSTARLVASTSQTFTNPLYGSFATANSANNYVARLTISGLTPGTTYYYGIEADGIIDSAADAIGRFRTFALDVQSFRFTVASCNDSGNHPVFYRIKDKDPLFHITSGDFHYGNPDSATDINVHRAPMENTLAQPAMKAFLRNQPIAYMWDDHDYCGDNTGSLSVGRTNARLVFQEYVPHYPLPAGSGDVPIYQSFIVGRIKFILSDLRSERTAPGTSIMGAVQKAWFKNECLSAKNNNQGIIWISSVPWGGITPADTWAGYPEERTELSDFFRANGIQNLLIICGDAHMIALDDGRNHDYTTGANNPFKYTLLQAAAVNQVGSERGGPFSHGSFLNPTKFFGQYAALDITDNGGNSINIAITGYRVDSLGSESTLLTYSTTFSVQNALPIRIAHFSVTEAQQRGKVLLQWEMETGADTCQTTIVERSNDGTQFTTIDSEQCKATLSSSSHHTFIDNAPVNGLAYYRIKVVDQQGKAYYSGIERITFKNASFLIISNPVENRLQVSIRSTVTTLADYTIIDPLGKTITKGNLRLQAGQNQATVDVPQMTSGVYFFTLRLNGRDITEKFVRR
jgi:phosphodiesterase/alkaline phosphatase D-like protein